MHPEPLFEIFGHGVYLYGICMAVGMILCFVFLYIVMRKHKFSEASMDAILYIGVFATLMGIVFGMLFQAFYNYLENPAAGFKFGEGMTFIGGLIGGVVCFLGVWNLYVFVIRKKTKIGFLTREMNAGLSDALPFIPIGITIAHAFGRLGCFFAGCCYGNPTTEWYGLPCAAGKTGNYVPMQLFEMIFLLILGAVLAFLYFKYKFNYGFSVYAIAYGIWRFSIEFFRGDDRGKFIGSLSPSQFWSIIMVIVGIGYVFLQMYVLAKLMKHPEDTVTVKEADTSDAAPVTNDGEQAPAPDEKKKKPPVAKQPEQNIFIDD